MTTAGSFTRRIVLVLLMVGLLAPVLPTDVAEAAPSTTEVQRALREKGFYRGSVDGRWNTRTQHAIMAFRKEIGTTRSYSWSNSLWDDLQMYQAPYSKFDEPDRVEINLTKQTAHLYRGGELKGSFPIASGNGERYFAVGRWRTAVTPTGNFKVYRRSSGWYESTLGLGSMYNPWFFNGGIALHGSNSVPARPASHGCVRLTIWDSDFLNKYMFIGMPVHVYNQPKGTGPVYGSDGPFADVPANHVFAAAIEWMVDQGYTNGCSQYFYCPGDPATRGEIAVFLKRSLQPYLGDNGRKEFVDTQGHRFEDAIGWLAGHGITLGCDPPGYTRFCPDRSVSRGEMSAMFKRAVDQLIVVDPASIDPGRFVDTQGHIFQNSTAWLAATGITVGCNPPDNTRFCPDQKVTRGQLAVFIKRILDKL